MRKKSIKITIIEENILLNIETVENLYRYSKLVNIMLEEFNNPTILLEQVDREDFVDILYKNYKDEQIVE